jgi:tetratricopeptide (TPR) repeat protein
VASWPAATSIELPLPELYDLESDPGETSNLIERQPDRRRALETQLRGFPAGTAATSRSQDPEAAARLRALGYVTGSASPKSKYTEDDDPKRLIGIDQAIHRGIETYQRQGPREAVPIFQQVIASRPTMELAYLHLAMLQWELGEPSVAILTLRSGLRAGAQGESLRTKLGAYLAESGSPAEAVPLLQEVTSGESPDLDALNALGIALQRSGRTREAVDTFNRILRLGPSNAMALENLGSIALGQGQLDSARRSYLLALQSDPTSSRRNGGRRGGNEVGPP